MRPLSIREAPPRSGGAGGPSTGSGKLPSGVRGRAPAAVAFCCIVCSQDASGCSISGSLVSTATCGKTKVNLYGIIFLGSKMAAP